MRAILVGAVAMKHLLSAVAVGLVAAAVPATARAWDENAPAVAANERLHFAFAPLLLVPLAGRPVGGGLDLEVRYGIPLDPVVLAPGGRITGYFVSGQIVFMGTPTVRVTFPVGRVAPYLTGGVGLGAITNSTEEGADTVSAWGVALIGGGGVVVHVGEAVGVGAEVTYQTITNSDFDAVAIGPLLVLGF